MDTRKVTLVAAIAIIALLAVGIGYAYVAFTSNSGNQTDVSYIKVTQVGQDTTPYTFADNVVLKYNTYNEYNENTMYYQFPNAVDISLTTGNDTTKYSCALLGSIQFHIEFAGSNILTPAPTPLKLNLSTSEKFEASNNWRYFITNADGSEIYAYKDTAKETLTWTVGPNDLIINKNANDNTYNDVPVYVYYGCLEGDYVDLDGDKYYKCATPPVSLSGGKLVFKVVSKATITYNANNGTDQTRTDSVYVGTSYTLLAEKPADFDAPSEKVFKGWSTDKNSSTALIGEQVIKDDITYYAIWGTT